MRLTRPADPVPLMRTTSRLQRPNRCSPPSSAGGQPQGGRLLPYVGGSGLPLCTCWKRLVYLIRQRVRACSGSQGLPHEYSSLCSNPRSSGRGMLLVSPTATWLHVPFPLDRGPTSPLAEPLSLIVPVQSAGRWCKPDSAQGSTHPCRRTLAGRSRRD